MFQFVEKKMQWRKFAREFNKKVKVALPMLEELSLADRTSHIHLAIILHECPGIFLSFSFFGCFFLFL